MKKILSVLFGVVFFLTLSSTDASAQTFNIGLTAAPGPDRGTVQLNWHDNDVIENYNLSYGPSANSHIYGALNIGNSSQYIVRGLTPGQRYYFSLSPIVSGTGLGYFSEVSAVATGTGTAHSSTVSQSTIVALPSGNTGDPWYLTAVTGSNPGEVNLTWQNTQPNTVDGFDLIYGSNGLNEHGNQGIRQNNRTYSFTVGKLNSGQRYFFSILPEKGDVVAGGFSQAVSAVAK